MGRDGLTYKNLAGKNFLHLSFVICTSSILKTHLYTLGDALKKVSSKLYFSKINSKKYCLKCKFYILKYIF